ncbi:MULTISPECIES: exopolysaccharide biosynthesis protein [unclassified Brevundimonas]|uniref:exopolysaccharide biosynthesis protein n=1 Tax=unclassified Brevundimonas TaxID=2622653 RepID=UPI0025C42274|nr:MULTISPECIES: exopolysaccharide biosynthesis protein [unclassified Brevundimonas]
MPAPYTSKHADEHRTFSNVLEGLGYGDDPQLTIREMVDAFGERGFGAMLLLLALMALFPWPPGGKAIFSVPIILISVEMAFQKSRLWLPPSIMRSSVQRATYRRLLNTPLAMPRWARKRFMAKGNGGSARWFRRRVGVTPRTQTPLSLLRTAERLTRPRWPLMTGDLADTFIGAACIFLAVMMALPVPFGDMLPGLAIAVLALGIVQRDGVFILIGAIGTAASAIYLVLVWKTVAAIATGLFGWFGNLF